MNRKSLLPVAILLSGLLFFVSCGEDETIDLTNLIGIEVFPGDTIMEVGTSVQFKAIGMFSDSSTKDITSSVSWAASPKGVVEISGGGLATALEKGETYVVAGGGFVVGGAVCVSTDAAGLDREKILLDYEVHYLGTNLTNCGWTGAVSGCNAGTASQESHDKVAERINYYRRMVGLNDDVTLDAAKGAKCQEAALMMKANNQLSHNPPSSWTCYTADGAEAAANSNIALGMHSVNAVTGYMDDFGANNKDVGHRRWILYSKAKVMGDGSTDGSNAIWVMGNSGNPYPANMPEYFSWPPKNYVPAPLVFDRWSFSKPDADFNAATVTMKDASNNSVTVSIIARSVGYGDNAIVWEPTGINLSGPGDVKYTVTVADVNVGGTPKTYTYSVIIVQPGKGKSDPYQELKRANPGWQIH